MQAETQQMIAALLRDTGAAHGAYEERELNGVYDQNWPTWYAAYAVQHGLGNLLGTAPTVEELSRLLKQCDEDYRRERPVENWPDYYAARLAEHVGLVQQPE